MRKEGTGWKWALEDPVRPVEGLMELPCGITLVSYRREFVPLLVSIWYGARVGSCSPRQEAKLSAEPGTGMCWPPWETLPSGRPVSQHSSSRL